MQELSLKPLIGGRSMTDRKPYSRIDYRKDRFVQHTAASRALEEINFVYELAGQNQRPVNLAITGEGGAGKTSIVGHFLERALVTHPEYSRFGFQLNISAFDLPPRVTRRKLLNCILNPKFPSEGNISLGKFAARAGELGIKLIVIDEFSELQHTHKNYKHEVLHTIKWIGNNLRIPFIVSGTDGITTVFKDDLQMARRFNVIKLNYWNAGREFEYFVYSYLKSLPGFEDIKDLPIAIFDTLLSVEARTTFDIVTTLGDAAHLAYANNDTQNIHVYTQQIVEGRGHA